MENKRIILELLLKNELSDKEKRELKKLLEGNPQYKKYAALVKHLRNTHLDADIISEYVLHINGLSTEKKDFASFIPIIEKHISLCDECRKEFELLNAEYAEVDNFVSERFAGEVSVKEKNLSDTTYFNIFNNRIAKYSFASAFTLVLIFFSLFAISELTVPNYKNVSSFTALDDLSFTRGRITEEFQKGLYAIKKNELSKALEYFNEDISKNGNDKSLFYTHYIMGLVYLEKSERDVLGLFPSYDEKDIDAAVLNFKKVIEKNNSGLFPNITYNAYYYLGRAYLLKDDFEQAKHYLNLTVQSKGSYSEEAFALLNSIKD